MEQTGTSILHPRTSISASHHVKSRMYLIVLVVVLSSTAKCDPPPDHDYEASAQNDVTTQTSVYPTFWSVIYRKFPQNMGEPTSKSLASSLSVYNEMKTLSTPSTSLKSSSNADSESQEYPMTKVTTNVDDRTTTSEPGTTMSGGNYDVILKTAFSLTPETTVYACDTDQLEVTTNPVHINASTDETYCSLLVNAPNSTAISVSVLDSSIDNVFTYFYVEILEESQTLINSKRIKLISLDSTPCVAILQGNQFRFHFQNTNIKVRICNKEDGNVSLLWNLYSPLIEVTQCRITAYKSEIQTSQKRRTFKYGMAY